MRTDAMAWDYSFREASEVGEETLDLVSLDGGLLPASALQYRIKDLQHWIDLSA
jgi:hypothetical protein